MQPSTKNPRRWWALVVLAAAQFVVIMDTSIIGVALPDIQKAFGFSQSSLSWVFNAYVIVFGGLLLLGGKLSDVLGARNLFVSGFALLTVGSLVAGLADSTGVEIAGRALQGAAAALIAPAALTMIMVLFSHDPGELTKAIGLYGAAAPVGGTAGVFLGGVLTQELDWRYTLLINVPVAVAVLAATPRLLPGAVTGLAGGIALFARLPANGGGYLSSFLPASLVAALGMSLAFVPAMIAAIGAAPPEPARSRSRAASRSSCSGSCAPT